MQINLASITRLSFIAFSLFLIACKIKNEEPFQVREGLFDQSDPIALGLKPLEGIRTITVFSPDDSTDKFSNGVVMTYYKGHFYCQWQSSARDEDASDTWVAYSRSKEGIDWSEPMVLAESMYNGYCTSGGWCVAGDSLISFINTWPSSASPRGGYTRFIWSRDGLQWSEPQAVMMESGDTLRGIFEQDPRLIKEERIVNAAHFQPGLVVNPIYTNDLRGISGWVRTEFNNLSQGTISRAIEPSTFVNEGGDIIMIFRDQESTFSQLASISTDHGKSWTTPRLTQMPDSRSKQCAGNLPNGMSFMVSNPVRNKSRTPLVITISDNGKLFHKAYVLRTVNDIQELRYNGKAKRSGYHYPKSFIHKNLLYISYSTNKEDVEITRISIAGLQ